MYYTAVLHVIALYLSTHLWVLQAVYLVVYRNDNEVTELHEYTTAHHHPNIPPFMHACMHFTYDSRIEKNAISELGRGYLLDVQLYHSKGGELTDRNTEVNSAHMSRTSRDRAINEQGAC